MLEGSLQEFSLADVFQLLTLTKKSGTLRVSFPDSEGEVHFRGGEVFFATSDTRRLQMGARMVAAGALDADTLRQLLADQRGAEPLVVTKALMDAGGVEEGALDAFLRDQIQDAVFTLVIQEEGEFRFESVDDPPVVLTAGVASDQLVEEAARRKGEWATVREVVPSLSAVVAMAPKPPGPELTLSAQEWALLTLADGRRTVGELVDVTGAGEFATCTLLAKLSRSGLVEIAETAADTTLAQLVAAREALRELERVDGPVTRAPVVPDVPESEPVAEVPEPVVEVPEPVVEVPEPVVEVPEPVVEEPQPEPEPEPQPEPEPEPEPQPEPEPEPEPVIENAVAQEPVPEPTAPAKPAGRVDRSQVARELAALGLDAGLSDAPRPAAKPSSNGAGFPSDNGSKPAAADKAAPAQLSRDGDINKGLLLRLIDGVKGA